MRPVFISIRTGAFVAGIIVPREGGLAIALTEKLEDMVAIIFLPLVRLFHYLRFPATPANVVPLNSTSLYLDSLQIWGS
jgi:hypothetical protein